MPHTQINLLPEGKVAKVTSNPILAWYSKIGMYVLIPIYILAIGGLAYRWYLEQQLADANDEIRNKSEQVSQKQDFIKEYQKLQNGFKVLGAIEEEREVPKVDYLHFIKATIPKPISLKSMSVTTSSITLSATSTQYGAINQWYRFIESSRLLITDSKYVEALNKGELPEELGSLLSEKGFGLNPDDTKVEEQEENQWSVSDNEHKLLFRLEDDGLNVFINPPLFKSVQMNKVERNLRGGNAGGLVNFDLSITM